MASIFFVLELSVSRWRRRIKRKESLMDFKENERNIILIVETVYGVFICMCFIGVRQ